MGYNINQGQSRNQQHSGKNKRNNKRTNGTTYQNQYEKTTPPSIGKQSIHCNNCGRTNHTTAYCKLPKKNPTNTVRNAPGSIMCKYCQMINHSTADCKNDRKKSEYNAEEERKAVAAGKPYCIICEKRGHSVDTCNKVNGNTTERQTENPTEKWCCYCNTREHITSRCAYEARKAEYYRSDPSITCSTCGWKGHTNVCNNPLPAAFCTFCHHSGHIEQHCSAEQADPEKIWCKFCNQTNHSTLSCRQKDPQRRFHTMHEVPMNICTRCQYKAHDQQTCTNPLPDARCEHCLRAGHSRNSCPVQGSKKRIYDSLRSQVHRELNDRNAAHPGFTPKTQTLKVPSNFVTDMSSWMVGIRSSEIFGFDLRRLFDTMRSRSQQLNYGYYHMPWSLHCLHEGFKMVCGYEGCGYDCRIVDTGFDPILGQSQLDAYDDRLPEHLVFLETTCCHPGWSRHMVWTRERAYEAMLREATQTLVKFSADGEREVRREFFESAEMTEEMTRLNNVAMLRTQKQRTSVNKAAPGTVPPVVDEMDAAFDRERGEDTINRGLDAMDMDDIF